jgi:hypothetical protein
MREILIACGDVTLLKQLIAELPAQDYKPIATKRGAGIAQKISGRGLLEAIVHDTLEDGTTDALIAELRALDPTPKILLLCGQAIPGDKRLADVALGYPCPGPVFRNALKAIAPQDQSQADLDTWRLFFRELKQRNAQVPELDYYAIMGIPQDAPHHMLVKAFDALSLRYHPDRYNQFRSERWGEAIYQEANILYKMTTEAYGILSSRKMRALYDKLLTEGTIRLSLEEANNLKNAGPKSVEELGTSQASRKFLKLAQTDIATMSWDRALQNLRFALSMEPSNQDILDKITEIEAKL